LADLSDDQRAGSRRSEAISRRVESVMPRSVGEASKQLEPLEQSFLVLIESNSIHDEAQSANCCGSLVIVELSSRRSPEVSGAEPLKPVPQALLNMISASAALREPQRVARRSSPTFSRRARTSDIPTKRRQTWYDVHKYQPRLVAVTNANAGAHGN
jgi:hypothetical protein